jgi:hypothetical protein
VVGLPQATGDIGNWSEPLGLASLMVEGCLIALSSTVLLGSRSRATIAVRPRASARTQSRWSEEAA